jgi:hypothetical protein
VALREAQRQALIDLLTRELKPPRRTSQYGFYVTFVQMSQLPEGKLKPAFDAAQWKAVSKLLGQYKGAEQWLKRSGQWPEADDEDDAAPATGGKSVSP